MPAAHPFAPSPQLVLRSRIEDLGQVWPWVEALAAQYSVSEQTRFAIHLCLEEALSNIVNHGYAGEDDRPITVECKPSDADELVFIVEDEAPCFDPFAYSQLGLLPAPVSIEEIEPGGQGIRLMRRFANRFAWEPIPNGNRLTLAFALQHRSSNAPID